MTRDSARSNRGVGFLYLPPSKPMGWKGIRVGLVFATLSLTACGLSDQQTETEARTAQQGVGDAPAPSVSCGPEPLHEEFAALPAWMAVNDEHVFWIEQRAGVLYRQAKGAGEPEALRSGLSAWWGGIAADADAAYVAGLDGPIYRVPSDGAAGIVVSSIGGERASQLHAQAGYVYWLSSSGNPSSGRVSVAVRRARANGSAASEELWSSNRASYGLAVHGDDLFVDEYTWPSVGAEPEANGVIRRVGMLGAPPVTLATNLLFPFVHAADERFVYFSAQTHDSERRSQLWRVSIDGGAPELLFDGTPYGIDVGQMVVQAGVAWWGQADDGMGVVRRMSADPADATDVAQVAATHHMLGFAVDADALYFSSGFSHDDVGPGVIWRVGRQCPAE